MRAAWILPLIVVLLGTPAPAADPNVCDVAGEAPDLILGKIESVARMGSVNGITAYSIGASSCNVGSCWADWFANDERHPVFSQNLFRLIGGRFEQLGQSWVAHRFFALSQNLCDTGCLPTNGTHLGVACSSSNSTSTNSYQPNAGPKSEVDPASGTIVFPFSTRGLTGNAIYKRLQVADADLDPVLNPGALYFIEGQNVAADDAAAGHTSNNASYRPVVVIDTGGIYELALTGTTVVGEPAIHAWATEDPGVVLDTVAGLFVASRAFPLAAGVWRYEYAVQNLTSERAVGSVSIPVPASGISAVGFHDVAYHSGETFDGSDWSASLAAGALTWTTESFAVDPDANALRWGTLYNFRFEADSPPVAGSMQLGLFRPGTPNDVAAAIVMPERCATNPDADGDGFPYCEDCDDDDAQLWSAPGEPEELQLDASLLTWVPPIAHGGVSLHYEVLRSTAPADFTGAIALSGSDPSVTWLEDAQIPPPGGLYAYVVRALNDCP